MHVLGSAYNLVRASRITTLVLTKFPERRRLCHVSVKPRLLPLQCWFGINEPPAGTGNAPFNVGAHISQLCAFCQGYLLPRVSSFAVENCLRYLEAWKMQMPQFLPRVVKSHSRQSQGWEQTLSELLWGSEASPSVL